MSLGRITVDVCEELDRLITIITNGSVRSDAAGRRWTTRGTFDGTACISRVIIGREVMSDVFPLSLLLCFIRIIIIKFRTFFAFLVVS